MGKKSRAKNADKARPKAPPAPAAPPRPVPAPVGAAPPGDAPLWSRFWVQAAALAALAFALYANTLGHGYAFDDGIVIRENAYVQEGFGGLGKIFSRDAFDSYFQQKRAGEPQLSGGRYRPLSIATFAVEHAWFGDNPRVRHFVNVLLYAATAVALLWLLRTQLLRDAAWSFLATLLFVVHPLHTEAVANIKGRDEVLSFLFIVLTLAFALRYDERRRLRDLALALAAFFLALLSKEYALVLVGLLPIAFFTANRRGAAESLRLTLPYVVVVAVYLSLRIAAVGLHTVASTEVLTNPYLYATPAEALATKLALLLRYLGLLFFPFPLSSDYSYRQIPYLDFGSAWPWVSVALHATLLAWAVALVVRRDVRGFAVLFYLATLALVSNLVVDIGAFLGERLVYHGSLGFAVIVAWAVLAAVRRAGAGGQRGESAARIALGTAGVAVAAVTIAAGALTIDRNRDWKDDFTLFTHDVRVSPESALTHTNAGMHTLDAAELPENAPRRDEMREAAIRHFRRAIEIHPQLLNAHVNLGTAYFRAGRLDDAEREWLLARKLRANDPMVERNLKALASGYLNKGLDVGAEREWRPALEWFEKALRFDPGNAVIWTNIGKAHFWLKEQDQARAAFRRALELEPGRKDAVAGLAATGGSSP